MMSRAARSLVLGLLSLAFAAVVWVMAVLEQIDARRNPDRPVIDVCECVRLGF